MMPLKIFFGKILPPKMVKNQKMGHFTKIDIAKKCILQFFQNFTLGKTRDRPSRGKKLGWIEVFYPPKMAILGHCVAGLIKFLKIKFLKVLEDVKFNSKQLLFYEIF